MIFPFYKRATAIGICNFIARAFTILSSLAAELDRPLPAILLIGLTTIALIDSFFLPSKQMEDDYDDKMNEIVGKDDENESENKDD